MNPKKIIAFLLLFINIIYLNNIAYADNINSVESWTADTSAIYVNFSSAVTNIDSFEDCISLKKGKIANNLANVEFLAYFDQDSMKVSIIPNEGLMPDETYTVTLTGESFGLLEDFQKVFKLEILFSDDFSLGIDKWNQSTPNAASYDSIGEYAVLENAGYFEPNIDNAYNKWQNYTLEFKGNYQSINGYKNPRIQIHTGGLNNYNCLMLSPRKYDVNDVGIEGKGNYYGIITHKEASFVQPDYLKTYEDNIFQGNWCNYKISVIGNRFDVYVDNVLSTMIKYSDGIRTTGSVSFLSNNGNGDVWLDDVIITKVVEDTLIYKEPLTIIGIHSSTSAVEIDVNTFISIDDMTDEEIAERVVLKDKLTDEKIDKTLKVINNSLFHKLMIIPKMPLSTETAYSIEIDNAILNNEYEYPNGYKNSFKLTSLFKDNFDTDNLLLNWKQSEADLVQYIDGDEDNSTGYVHLDKNGYFEPNIADYSKWDGDYTLEFRAKFKDVTQWWNSRIAVKTKSEKTHTGSMIFVPRKYDSTNPGVVSTGVKPSVYGVIPYATAIAEGNYPDNAFLFGNDVNIFTNDWHNYRISVKENLYEVYIDGELYTSVISDSINQAGSFSFMSNNATSGDYYIDDVSLTTFSECMSVEECSIENNEINVDVDSDIQIIFSKPVSVEEVKSKLEICSEGKAIDNKITITMSNDNIIAILKADGSFEYGKSYNIKLKSHLSSEDGKYILGVDFERTFTTETTNSIELVNVNLLSITENKNDNTKNDYKYTFKINNKSLLKKPLWIVGALYGDDNAMIGLGTAEQFIINGNSSNVEKNVIITAEKDKKIKNVKLFAFDNSLSPVIYQLPIVYEN